METEKREILETLELLTMQKEFSGYLFQHTTVRKEHRQDVES